MFDVKTMATNTIQLHRVIRAKPGRIYRAFLDADAMTKWLPLNGFTCKVHQLDANMGGTFKNFATGQIHSFSGTYVDLQPDERIRDNEKFDDPDLAGDIETAITLKPVSVGTELNIHQQGLPEVISAEACYLGWQESLTLLSKLVEAEVG